MTRITITRNRTGRVRIGFAADDFAALGPRLRQWAKDESAFLQSANHQPDAEAMARLGHALDEFKKKEAA